AAARSDGAHRDPEARHHSGDLAPAEPTRRQTTAIRDSDRVGAADSFQSGGRHLFAQGSGPQSTRCRPRGGGRGAEAKSTGEGATPVQAAAKDGGASWSKASPPGSVAEPHTGTARRRRPCGLGSSGGLVRCVPYSDRPGQKERGRAAPCKTG